MSDANRGEAMRCLDIARAAAAAHDLLKAERFAEKAMRLFPSDEVPPLHSSEATVLLSLAVDAHRLGRACSPGADR